MHAVKPPQPILVLFTTLEKSWLLATFIIGNTHIHVTSVWLVEHSTRRLECVKSDWQPYNRAVELLAFILSASLLCSQLACHLCNNYNRGNRGGRDMARTCPELSGGHMGELWLSLPWHFLSFSQALTPFPLDPTSHIGRPIQLLTTSKLRGCYLSFLCRLMEY